MEHSHSPFSDLWNNEEHDQELNVYIGVTTLARHQNFSTVVDAFIAEQKRDFVAQCLIVNVRERNGCFAKMKRPAASPCVASLNYRNLKMQILVGSLNR